ncbi:TIGR01777 family oxidoreductase [Tenacibaculum tangerinum]|uniref:TIGR01777 family oxidoreductase n=1 Tax=Tenacibaculum tangerinum TaxID=3038772 RepID=A0ABY8L8F0_9FLAO|nr:TIGR01777 family oxidoreductase [Tenacibaculum tangerinum]WGH76409.1 TIGR01777 family oxidoreductase [Tenacibaculum tangerinum]
MNTILITGGTGLIGSALTKKLNDKGYRVHILTRSPKENNEFRWDIKEGYIDKDAFANVRYIIHLAGAGIADERWTDERKQELVDSRVKTANLLFHKVQEYQVSIKKFISASGIGYYGAVTSDKIFAENDAPGSDFISETCVQWENAARQFEHINIPVTILRTGVVLTKNGGALPKMNTPLFLAALGNGKQYMPWIHIDDLCELYIKAIEDEKFTGAYNAVAPEHQTNESFTKLLGKVIDKWVLPINAPSFILKLVLGEMACILLEGSRISAEKTSEFYNFKFPDLRTALNAIYND